MNPESSRPRASAPALAHAAEAMLAALGQPAPAGAGEALALAARRGEVPERLARMCRILLLAQARPSAPIVVEREPQVAAAPDLPAPSLPDYAPPTLDHARLMLAKGLSAFDDDPDDPDDAGDQA